MFGVFYIIIRCWILKILCLTAISPIVDIILTILYCATRKEVFDLYVLNHFKLLQELRL
jgi:hypothetical protein